MTISGLESRNCFACGCPSRTRLDVAVKEPPLGTPYVHLWMLDPVTRRPVCRFVTLRRVPRALRLMLQLSLVGHSAPATRAVAPATGDQLLLPAWRGTPPPGAPDASASKSRVISQADASRLTAAKGETSAPIQI